MEDNNNPFEQFLPPEDENKPVPTELTEEQKALILKTWQESATPPSLKKLVQLCFGPGLDGRDKRAKLVKEFLGQNNLDAPVSYIYQKRGAVELTAEQKEFINNNVETMTCLEMAEVLFSKRLSNLSMEVQIVIAHAKTLDTKKKFADLKNIVSEKYKVPRQDPAMIERINKYIDEPIEKNQYERNDKQKRWVKALISYINCYRFIQTINNYEVVEDRDLFESSFISYIYGKDDLTTEERDQYIMLCSEVVSGKHITARINKYERIADESIDGSDENGRKLSMTFVEAISNLRKEHNDCVKRQQSLIDDLKGKRSIRLKDKIKENESMLTLMEYWKNETTRKRMIDYGIVLREKAKKEVTRLENMDALKFEIFGVGPDEILNS